MSFLYKLRIAAAIAFDESCGLRRRTADGEGALLQEILEFHTRKGPTLWPSIGNWQKDCRSHYYIRDGKVLWQSDWAVPTLASLSGKYWSG